MPSSNQSECDANADGAFIDLTQLTILDKLKVAKKSDLACKRMIEKPKSTRSDKKKWKAGAPFHTDSKTVSPATRVKEFMGECLEVRHGKLFCVACREEHSLKKSTVKNHIYSGHKSHLADYVPLLLKQQKGIWSELECQYISAIFDGTTRYGETLAIVVCFVQDCKIEQHLVWLLLLAKLLVMNLHKNCCLFFSLN